MSARQPSKVFLVTVKVGNQPQKPLLTADQEKATSAAKWAAEQGATVTMYEADTPVWAIVRHWKGREP